MRTTIQRIQCYCVSFSHHPIYGWYDFMVNRFFSALDWCRGIDKIVFASRYSFDYHHSNGWNCFRWTFMKYMKRCKTTLEYLTTLNKYVQFSEKKTKSSQWKYSFIAIILQFYFCSNFLEFVFSCWTNRTLLGLWNGTDWSIRPEYSLKIQPNFGLVNSAKRKFELNFELIKSWQTKWSFRSRSKRKDSNDMWQNV